MGYRNREIEQKFQMGTGSFKDAVSKVKGAIKRWDHVMTGSSTDIYFDVPSGLSADFARVRMMPGGKAQLTIKHQDQESIKNRVEIDVLIDDPAQGIAFCTQLFGLPARSVRKRYVVLFLDKRETNVSLYKIHGDKRIFVEVEARTEDKVSRLAALLTEALDLTNEDRSIYQIFVEQKR